MCLHFCFWTTTILGLPEMISFHQAPGNLSRLASFEFSQLPVLQKKKADGLLIGSGSKKHKGMNSLVAKWNKVNKHADTALK